MIALTGNKAAVSRLDDESGSKPQRERKRAPAIAEVPVIGGPSRTRPLDPLIESEDRDLRTAMHDDVSAHDSEGW